MYWPFFSLGCQLEINSQRTAAYLRHAGDTCGDGDMSPYMDLKCDCGPLHWTWDDNDVPLPAVYTTPEADQAPWYDASIPESAQFLGFLIEDVTQNSVVSRNLTTRISSSGGGVIGPIRAKERRLDFTVLMFACNEPAMEYGFRYLTDALGSPGCDDGCTLCDAEFRDSCPQVDGSSTSLNKGRWLLKNVGMVEGPVWGEHPLQGSTCNLRRVTFSIASEFPWKYKCPVIECEDVALAGFPSEGTDCDNWDEILCGKQEVSCSVAESLIIGETGLIIEVQAGSVPLQHIEIAIRPDKFGYECDAGTRPVGYTREEPCDLIYIPEIPASSRLVYDTSIESIVVVLPGGGELDGVSFVATDEGRPPTFPTLRCGEFCVSVAVSECSVVGSPTVTISSIHREI
jgi:hypothetical protein